VLGALLPDADDGREPGAVRGYCLGANVGICLVVIGAAFRMADDDSHGAGILEHFGGDIAGMSASGLGVTILAADQKFRVLGRPDALRDQGGRRTDHQVGGNTVHAGNDFRKLGQRGGKAVHLPVARHQRAYWGWRHLIVPFRVRLSDPLERRQSGPG
jgi:hypothetical protein